jgi:hypothetical protein
VSGERPWEAAFELIDLVFLVFYGNYLAFMEASTTVLGGPAVIEVDEQLGSEILLDMKVGEGVMVACAEPPMRVKVRDRLRVAMRPSRLHVFDAKTEAAI